MRGWIPVGLLLFVAAAMLYGGGLLMFAPSYASLQTSIRGALLIVIFGVGALAAAVATLARVRWAPLESVVIGLGVSFWLAAQGTMVAFGSPLQLEVLAMGIAIAALAAQAIDSSPRRTGTPKY